MNLESSGILSATGTPLCSIPELSSEDEFEHEDDDYFQDGRVRAMFTDDVLITTSEEKSSGKSMGTPARSLRLSINMSFLSPSSPTPGGTSMSHCSPPSATYSSCSSAVSSPGGSAFSPILNPFQCTSDIRQYIMTDIGPQPSNSQVPALRSHLHLVRQRTYSKLGGATGGGFVSPTSPGWSGNDGAIKGLGVTLSPNEAPMSASFQTQSLAGQYGNKSHSSYERLKRFESMTELCSIPQRQELDLEPAST
ncbi:hypothetical protein BGZ76_008140 [Entomortierella beljakovae]|nr:hypothetical protein BGZ76_008140 [Entomortierella beljakovae]